MSSAASKKKDDDYGVEGEEIQEHEIPVQRLAKRPPVEPCPALATSDDPNFFDINPMKKACQFCSLDVVTYVEHEVNPFFGLGALAVFAIFGFLAFIILPIAFLLTKNAVHRCSRCLQKMGEKQCFGLPDDFSQHIWHFRLGKCSIVTSRIYAMITFGIFGLLSCSYVYMRPTFMMHHNPLSHHNEEQFIIDTTWPEFLKDCGGEQVIENFVHTKMVFNDKYENNVINWSGYFAEVKTKHTPLLWFSNAHQLNVMVKMSPSESPMFADLVLSISSQVYNENKVMFDSLKKGDGIDFEGFFVGLGNEFKMHHLHAKSVFTNGQFKPLDEIIVRESALP